MLHVFILYVLFYILFHNGITKEIGKPCPWYNLCFALKDIYLCVNVYIKISYSYMYIYI